MENPIQYPKPKIILIDLDEETELKLKGKGFNIITGSFGKPYKVDKKDDYDFIYSDYQLPDLREQEIIIIDQSSKDFLESYPESKITRDGDSDIRVRLIDGLVDPRPICMFLNSDNFSTIWKHGGIFIVFADRQFHNEYLYSKKGSYGWLNEKELNVNLWSFLNFLNNQFVDVIPNSGYEFKSFEKENKWSLLLLKYLNNSKYNVVLMYKVYNKEYFDPILLNKYDEVVSSLISKLGKGFLIVLPQIQKKADLINELLTTLLPEKFPELFPYYEGKIWLNSPIYDLESVKKIKNEKDIIIRDKEELINSLEQKISEEKNKICFLYNILTETGTELVEATEQVLKFIEFNDVKNIDKELMEKDIKKQKQEDLQIMDMSPTILAEIKGITGLPREDDTFQIVKYMTRRMKEWKRTDIRGLVIVNHQKNLPPLRREKNPFTQQQMEDSLQNDFGLISTWDLFLLIKGMLKYGWDKDFIKSKLYKFGIIDNVPSHYKYIGLIENFWEHHNVVGVRLENTTIKKGDIISFVTDNDYLEQMIDSLQVENIDRNEATDEELAGIKTVFSKEILKKKLKVYKVNY